VINPNNSFHSRIKTRQISQYIGNGHDLGVTYFFELFIINPSRNQSLNVKEATMETFEKIRVGKETVALRLFAMPMQYSSGVTFHVDVVYVENENKSYVQSMGFYNNYFSDKNQYKGLCVKATMHCDDVTPSQYEVHINTDRDTEVTIERAMAMVKTLKPIKRKLLKLDNQLGEPDNFEEYVCRLANVLNCRAFYHTSLTSNTDRTEYRNGNISQLRQTLKSMIAANIKTLSVA
jgi:hypothetical protein